MRPALNNRYALLIALEPQDSIHQVSELVDHLQALGVDLGPLPSKSVSNLLRAERARGRVERVAWGKYRLGYLPRTTRHRAKLVVASMRSAAAHRAEEKSLQSGTEQGSTGGLNERLGFASVATDHNG
jgi:hypothetical protein